MPKKEMHKIVCPHCKRAFNIEKSDYEALLKQVKTSEFNVELKERLDNEKDKYKNQLEKQRLSYEEEMANIESKYEKKLDNFKYQLQLKDNELEQAKNYKLQLSTKGIGEDLEKYCEAEFEKVRRMGFPYAYFEKDNKVSSQSGSKGDFIFRDYDSKDKDKIELTSIMFEMKNERSVTKSKHKNEDFLKELDKDRKEKKCEYAVLVSTLEADNDIYNAGIYDVSHKYPKMYVVRPQFFIPIISLIRNASTNVLEIRNEIAKYENQNATMRDLNERIKEFKFNFGGMVTKSSDKFNAAIKKIDDTIVDLQKVKENLMSSGKELVNANNLLMDFSLTDKKGGKKNANKK